MKLLALDTATPYVVVAAYDGERGFERVCETPMKHGEQLAPLIRQVLADAGWSPADLTGIVVGVGPGPFTGLRVGLVTARTMGFVLGVPVQGVCTLDVFARDAGIEGPFTVVTDARRREVYAARYDSVGGRIGAPEVVLQFSPSSAARCSRRRSPWPGQSQRDQSRSCRRIRSICADPMPSRRQRDDRRRRRPRPPGRARTHL